MNYSPEQFLALMEAVEEDGGVHLSAPCTPQPFTLQVPVRGKRKPKRFFTVGCRQQSRFLVETGGEPATVCAVDDDMGKWPRYAHAMEAGS